MRSEWMTTQPRYSKWLSVPEATNPANIRSLFLKVDGSEQDTIMPDIGYRRMVSDLLRRILNGGHAAQVRSLGRGHIRILLEEKKRRYRFWFESEQKIRNTAEYAASPAILGYVREYNPMLELVWYATSTHTNFRFGTKVFLGHGNCAQWATTTEVENAVKNYTLDAASTIQACARNPKVVVARGRRKNSNRERARRQRKIAPCNRAKEVAELRSAVRSTVQPDTAFLSLLCELKNEMRVT